MKKIKPEYLTKLPNPNSAFRIPNYLMTRTVHLTSFPSALIVIVVVPALFAVTRPVAETVAIPGEPEEYVGVRTVAFDGLMTGSSWYVSPILRVMVFCGIVMEATGTLTVTVHEAIFAPLSLVAVMIAVPAETPVTLPFGSTLATFSSLEVHDTPLIDALDGLYETESVPDAPVFKVSACLLIITEVTGLASALTVTLQEAFMLPAAFVTVIVAVPALIPVTTPLSTVATAVFDELHLRASLSAL